MTRAILDCRIADWDEDLLAEEMAAEAQAVPHMRPKPRVVYHQPKRNRAGEPVTVQILAILRDDGPMTAAQAASRLIQRPSNISTCMTSLLAQGLIERVTPKGKRPTTYRARSQQ